MNEAQLFVFFLSVLFFGWMGFFAGKAMTDSDEKDWHFAASISFILGSAGLFIFMIINLIALIQKNF